MIESLIKLNPGEGTQTGAVSGPIGGQPAADVAAATAAVEAATDVATAGTLVKRKAGTGEVAVGALTAASVNAVATRVIASGLDTSIPTAANTVIGTYTRNAGEAVRFSMFLKDDTAQIWHDEANIHYTLTRTTNANEFVLKVTNISGTNQHIDWVLEGVKAV